MTYKMMIKPPSQESFSEIENTEIMGENEQQINDFQLTSSCVESVCLGDIVPGTGGPVYLNYLPLIAQKHKTRKEANKKPIKLQIKQRKNP